MRNRTWAETTKITKVIEGSLRNRTHLGLKALREIQGGVRTTKSLRSAK